MRRGLLLDIGDVIIDPRRGLAAFEAATGTRVETPVGGDQSWDTAARRVGYPDWRTLFRAIADAAPDDIFDPAALALIADARADGCRVGVLSNDAYAIQGREYFAQRREFAGLDAFVDATALGVRKPAAEAYLRAAEALGVEPERVVFLDDTADCVIGARAVGMVAIEVDPLDRLPAFAEARARLGLA